MKSSTIDRFDLYEDEGYDGGMDILGMEESLSGEWCRYADVAAELDRQATKLDAAYREIRELHGELADLRAHMAAFAETDLVAALARLGACQARCDELESVLNAGAVSS